MQWGNVPMHIRKRVEVEKVADTKPEDSVSEAKAELPTNRHRLPGWSQDNQGQPRKRKAIGWGHE